MGLHAHHTIISLCHDVDGVELLDRIFKIIFACSPLLETIEEYLPRVLGELDGESVDRCQLRGWDVRHCYIDEAEIRFESFRKASERHEENRDY